ncbi:PIG-L family deacetylase [Candidatus Sumerlaeota bacterium]|nr:PIG-L family deacetylase [Candidatus Sumerlaeota bacterium]MBI3737007.1 PIG-L family deacetylase [Candidatus Sumerlaeota bacterium]
MGAKVSLVAVMAHPDDIEIHIAGTLCLLRNREDYRVHFVTVCNGDCGSATRGREEIAEIRAAEAAKAAAIFGATYDGLGVGDLRLMYCPEIKDKIIGVLRKYHADIVITHARADYMADHEITSMLTREACFAAPAPNWACESEPDVKILRAIPELYYADPTSQTDAAGKFVEMPIVIDISSVIRQKEQLLKCHASQRDWLARQHGEDNYINTMREWGKIRGNQKGVELAEGLSQHLGHPFPKHSRLKEDLKEFVLA